MHYFFKPHEANYKEWVKTGFAGIPEPGIAFLKHLSSSHFKPNMELFSDKQWKMQIEAIQRCVYCFEILGEKDLLTNIYEPLKDRISIHIMKPSESPAGIRAGTIILGNIHQIYERTDNWRVLRDNVESLCIFNDEAHNTKAEQYDDLMNKLKPKRFFRLDTTATPDRLDGLHPDSKMIFVYPIAEAMRDKIVKRIVVFHPDVQKVNLTYEDLETGKTISAEEVPWEEIERRKIRATRYITSTNPMRQQIAIALELLKHQKIGTPPKFKPLLFVVAISIADAERIKEELERVGKDYGINKVLLVTNESDDELKDAARDLNKNPQTEYDAVVSVLMLREGWDVRNISVILLFRKFSYKEVDGQIFSVYGPQVIGRGLRRMSKNPEEWESLFIVDHPILKHAWLWDHLKATIYPEALDPANIIIDTEKIPEDKNTDKINEGEKTLEEAERFLNINDPTPEPPEVLEPIYEWQKYLDNYKYDFNRMDIEQDVTRIKSLNIDSEHVTSEKSDIPEIEIEKIARVTKTEDWSIEELKKQLTKQIHSMARYALLEYDRNPDERQVILVKIIRDHIRKGLLGGVELDDSKDEALLRRLWAIIDQVRDVFLTPELIEGIFMKKK